MSAVAELLGSDAVAALQRPIESARALPAKAYTDADFFALEGKPTLRCPYHGWAYGLDGRLRATPLWDGKRVAAEGAVDRASLGLVPVRSGVFADVVFVDLSGTAPPLAEFVRPLATRWAPYRTEDTRLALYVPGEIAANWKLGVEGAL